MPARDIVVVGASAGGIEALLQLVQGLPAGLPASLFITCHMSAEHVSALPEVLSRKGRLLAKYPHDGEEVRPGQIYVAPQDRHLTLEPGVIRVRRGPREHHFRPAIDPLFRTAARAYGSRVVGVLLSGALADGVAGLLAIRNAGGLRVLQDPDDALFPALPRHAREVAGADYVVPAREMAALLVRLATQQPPPAGAPVMPEKDPLEKTSTAVERDFRQQARGDRRGEVSIFTCPECGGSLWEVDEKELLRFRCHVGHIYEGNDLLLEQAERLEAALWTAVRTFKERGVLSRQLAARSRGSGEERAASRFDEEARLADQYAELVERYILQGNGLSSPRGADATAPPSPGAAPPGEATGPAPEGRSP